MLAVHTWRQTCSQHCACGWLGAPSRHTAVELWAAHAARAVLASLTPDAMQAAVERLRS